MKHIWKPFRILKEKFALVLHRDSAYGVSNLESTYKTRNRRARSHRFVSHLKLYSVGATIVNCSCGNSLIKKFERSGIVTNFQNDKSTAGRIVIVDSCPKPSSDKNTNAYTKTVRNLSETEISLMISI